MDPNTKALQDMELEDSFFELDEKAKEEAFQSEFDDPFASTPPVKYGIEKPAEEDDTQQQQQQQQTEPFKFDDALAEEEAKELAELNAKLGSNFKDRNELDAALKKVEQHDKGNEIVEEKKYINYFRELLDLNKYPDDVLVREDKRLAAVRDGKNLNDPTVAEQIDYEVNQLSESGALSYAASSIRQTLKTELREKERVVKEYEDSQRLTIEEQQKKYKTELQEGINDIFKSGKFLGVALKKEDMLEVYKDISKNKHLEHLKAHPKDAVEFALFKRFKDIISKNLGKPNYEAGVKNTLNELGMSNSSQTGTSGNDITKDNNEAELTFLQRFAK